MPSAWLRQAMERIGTASASAAIATTNEAATPATINWCRLTQRRARAEFGSRQAVTGSSASHSSTSSASRHRRGVSPRRLRRHRFEANGIQISRDLRLDRSWRIETALTDVPEHVIGVARERRLARQQDIEGRAEAVDVARRPQELRPARGLLRAHVSRRPHGLARECYRAASPVRPDRRGPSATGCPSMPRPPPDHPTAWPRPIHDQGLAERPQHDVAWLDVPMQDTAAMGVADRVADIDEPPQEPAELPSVEVAEVPAWNRRAAAARSSPSMNRMA